MSTLPQYTSTNPFSSLSPELPQHLRHSLDSKGLAVVPDFFSPEFQQIFIDEIMASVAHARPSGGGHKYSLKYDEIAHHTLYRLIKTQEFSAFINAVLRGWFSYVFTPDDITMGYSIIKGKGDRVPYHFDALNALNLIIPITLPPRPEAYVDLITYPNIATMQKSLWSSGLSRLLNMVPSSRRLFRQENVTYHQGELLLFYGSRTYHGVEPAPADGLRVIASINIRKHKR